MSERTVLVTGATGALGVPIVEALLTRGDRVFFTSRSPEKVSALRARLPDDVRDRAHGLCIDLEQPDAAGFVVSALTKAGIHPTALVHAARNPEHLAVNAAGDPDRAGWIGEYVLGTVVPYELSMALARQEGSRLAGVVLLSSIYGVVAPNPTLYDDPTRRFRPQYGVAKAATLHLTRYLAVMLAPRGIRANAVVYGGVGGREGPDFLDRYGRLCPQGRMLGKADVPGAVLFLCSDGASGMTGQTVTVDGGWSVW